MLIDWITARVPLAGLPVDTVRRLQAVGDRVMRFDPSTGDVRWTTAAWDSVRSDSHQVVVRVSSELWMQGSPARVMGDGCTVFGAGASAALDVAGCVDRMAAFLGGVLGVELPGAAEWIVSRIDVTGNLLLGSLAEVRSALATLRECEGGRYRVSQQAGDTVYWSHKSKMRAGKAYAKGPHLRYLLRRSTYEGREYAPADLEAADRLLRLELKLGREWLRRCDWRELTAADLEREWQEYFGRMIGSSEVVMDADLRERVMAAAPTEGRGRAAWGCWCAIQSQGWERAREGFARPTWYRHLQVLRVAGLGDADIAVGRVVALRRRVMDARLVRAWSEFREAA